MTSTVHFPCHLKLFAGGVSSCAPALLAIISVPPLLLIAPCRAGTTISRAAHLHGGAVVPVRKQICWDLSEGGQAGTAAAWPPSQKSRTGAPSVGRERGTSSNVGGGGACW